MKINIFRGCEKNMKKYFCQRYVILGCDNLRIIRAINDRARNSHGEDQLSP